MDRLTQEQYEDKLWETTCKEVMRIFLRNNLTFSDIETCLGLISEELKIYKATTKIGDCTVVKESKERVPENY